jgi:hypothetical protein
MEERMAQMSPEERERFQARMKEFGAGGGRGGFGGNREGAPGGNREGGFAGTRDGGGNREAGAGGGRGMAQGGNRQGRAGGAAAANEPQSRTMASGATTIDSLFAPIQIAETRGTAWQYENKQLKMLRLRLGVSDGTFSEVLNESEVPPNTEVVTSMTTGLEQRTTVPNQQQGNPLMGPQRGGPGGGGRGPGGGGRGF